MKKRIAVWCAVLTAWAVLLAVLRTPVRCIMTILSASWFRTPARRQSPIGRWMTKTLILPGEINLTDHCEY